MKRDTTNRTTYVQSEQRAKTNWIEFKCSNADTHDIVYLCVLRSARFVHSLACALFHTMYSVICITAVYAAVYTTFTQHLFGQHIAMDREQEQCLIIVIISANCCNAALLYLRLMNDTGHIRNVPINITVNINVTLWEAHGNNNWREQQPLAIRTHFLAHMLPIRIYIRSDINNNKQALFFFSVHSKCISQILKKRTNNLHIHLWVDKHF